MPRIEANAASLPVLSPDLQIQFWTRLQIIRREYLADSLAAAVALMDIAALDRELSDFIGNERLAALAALSLRGEALFPVPCLLRTRPMLLGYYRLLYGISQKEFYSKGPFGRFKAMEESNKLSPSIDPSLPALCSSLIHTAWQLHNGVQPLTPAVIHELQLLTIGPQLRGTQNNLIGQGATKTVFELVRGLVSANVTSSSEQAIVVKNAAGRVVRIAFAADPDIAIVETMPTDVIPSVSIEIKGGADVSNVHNRIGEAEKSHQKARAARFTQFWTITKARIDPATAQRESPTTTHFFYLDDILTPGSPAHERFRDVLFHTIGIA